MAAVCPRGTKVGSSPTTAIVFVGLKGLEVPKTIPSDLTWSIHFVDFFYCALYCISIVQRFPLLLFILSHAFCAIMKGCNSFEVPFHSFVAC